MVHLPQNGIPLVLTLTNSHLYIYIYMYVFLMIIQINNMFVYTYICIFTFILVCLMIIPNHLHCLLYLASAPCTKPTSRPSIRRRRSLPGRPGAGASRSPGIFARQASGSSRPGRLSLGNKPAAICFLVPEKASAFFWWCSGKTYEHVWVWVKIRVTPTWVALNGNKD